MIARRVLCSDGQLAARVDLVLVVPTSGEAPAVEAERVVLGDPSQLPSPVAPPASSGPRRLDQKVLPRRVPGIDLPDGLSALQAQRVMIDPEDWLAAPHRVEKT